MGVSIEDLIDIYILYIRSIAEYWLLVFHSSLAQEESNKIERIKKTCLKVININYELPCHIEGKKRKTLPNFSLKCVRHTKNKRQKTRDFSPWMTENLDRTKTQKKSSKWTGPGLRLTEWWLFHTARDNWMDILLHSLAHFIHYGEL